MESETLFARYRDLQRYVGWTEADAQRIASALPRVEPHFDALIEDFYEQIMLHEGARSVFTGGAAQVARLKQTLRQWLIELFSGQYDRDYVARRWRVGWRHVEIGLDQVYTNAALSRLRSGLVRALTTSLNGSDRDVRETLLSLHKHLDLDLAIIEDAYQAEYLRRVEQRTADREKVNAELLLLKHLALGIATQPSLDDAMCLTLQHICEATSWDCGEAWLAEDDVPRLVLRARCSEDPIFEEFHRASEDIAFAFGDGLPGNVWANREPLWIDNLSRSRFFRRKSLALACGLTAGLGVPIFSGENPVAVMTFFIRERREADARLVDLVTAAVAPLGPVIERKRFEDELAGHQRELERLVAERTAQLRQADRLAAIGTLAAGLGHDMHNVLLPVRTRLDVLEHDASKLPERLQEQLPPIRRAIAYLQELSDGLHLLSLDPSEDEATLQRTSLSDWWGQVGSLLAKTLPKRVAFHCEIPAPMPEVSIAPHRLTQAVLNLLVNAGEAIAEEGTVRLSAEHLPRRRAVRLSVHDTGEGMSEEVKRRAVDPFFTTKKRGLGTGLGLALVHGVVQSAGGSIEIESSPGAGTTVSLLLPAQMPAERSAAAGKPRRVAIVTLNDDRTAGFISSFMKAAGFDVTVESNESRSDPPHGLIWVLDPALASVSSARRFLRGGRDRKVIVTGQSTEDWASIGANVLDNPNDLEGLRRVVGDPNLA